MVLACPARLKAPMKPTPILDRDGVSLYCGDARVVIPYLDTPDDAGWVIDPPWDQQILTPMGARKLVFCDGHRQRDAIQFHGAPAWIFTWDCVTSWYVKGKPLRRAKYAFWYGPTGEYKFDGAHYGGERSDAPRVVENSRGAYVFQSDLRGKHLSDVFQYPITRLHASGHKHEKPVEWMKMLIANCFAACPVVVDPFCGSGSTLDACRQIGKQAIGVELDPDLCQKIAQRLAQGVFVA